MTELSRADRTLHGLATRLLAVAERGLPEMLLPDGGGFVFTRAGHRADDGSFTLERRGTSVRYAAITALGARFLPADRQRAVLGGHTAEEFTGLLIERLPGVRNLGDAALIAWAAAETGHPKLSDALDRVARLDPPGRPQYTVEAAWVLSALAAARPHLDVEQRLAAARDRLLRARIGRSPLFPHATGPGLNPWYRAHIGCFADQTYPCRPSPAPTRAATTRRRSPPPTPAPPGSAPSRARAASGGGTTTPATGPSSRATRSTACTSTPWPPPPCSTSPRPAAPTSASPYGADCAG
ncbi:hypothetical protein AB6O49_03715 [Streptomyces sp. SBR177]